MINSFNQQYLLTKRRIARIRYIKMSGSVDVYDLSRISNRALHLCLFDFILDRYRENHGRFGANLSGKVTANHEVSMGFA
ncbi:hypothetical protein D3C79_128550 [compost metagenome]